MIRNLLALWTALLTVFAAICAEATPRATPRATPTSANCTQLFFTQTLDHFNWLTVGPGGATTFQQRYFVCDQFWTNDGPIFFYFGNEDDITLYVNHTGLMWENAPTFNALLVFAEHRYYGQSQMFADGTPGCMQWLTSEQALADYATLIPAVQQAYGASASAVVGFGGSYGGMLAAWFRLKYPWLCAGVVAASAPILSFLGLAPPYDSAAFYGIVTDDASSRGGASDNCKNNFKAALPLMAQLGASAAGRPQLSEAFLTCRPLASLDEVMALIGWVQDPWATLAMGNYPYTSSYLMHGLSNLPPWPVRVACQPLDTPALAGADLLAAVREAVAVYYNNTGAAACFFNNNANDKGNGGPTSHHHHATMLSSPRTLLRSASARVGGSTTCGGDWGWQWCTEITQPFSSGTGADMFWPPSPFDLNSSIAGCQQEWGVTPRPLWAPLNLANTDLRSATNIVFSNGMFDPWHSGGVLSNQSDTVVALMIPNGAHHLDLMFSNPADPADVIAARSTELAHIRSWIAQHATQHSPRSNPAAHAGAEF